MGNIKKLLDNIFWILVGLNIGTVIVAITIDSEKKEIPKKEYYTTHQIIDSVVVKAGHEESIVFIYSRIVK